MDLREQLESIGIAGKRVDVYLSLLQLGSGTALEIAASSGIKRPTVYDILTDFQAQGLVGTCYEGKRRLFIAKDPQMLAEVQARRLDSVKAVMPQLSALYNLGPNKPRVNYHEGIDGLRKVSEDLLTVTSGEYFYFSSARDILAKFGEEYLKGYVRRRVERGIWSNAIRMRHTEEPDAEFLAGSEEFKRRLRFLTTPVFEEVVCVYIYDEKVAIISGLKENYAMIIESRELAVLLKAIWQTVWEVAEEP